MPRKPPIAPTCFVSSCPADYVGQVGNAAEMLLRKTERLRVSPDQPIKLLVSGAPGIGKTNLVNLIARTLVAHPAAIEFVNSREVILDTVREWLRGLPYRSLFGGRTVKVIKEFDRCSRVAQNLLLTLLYRMLPGHAFLARRWQVPIATTRMIAAGAAGNVRAAMADLEMWLGYGLIRLDVSRR